MLFAIGTVLKYILKMSHWSNFRSLEIQISVPKKAFEN